MNLIQRKRIYSILEDSDGFRILIDRLWPRGLKRDNAAIDFWYKEIAPSLELRVWFHHKPERFDLFRDAYRSELDQNPISKQLLEDCRAWLCDKNVTLLYAAKDEMYNHAVVLQKWLTERISDLPLSVNKKRTS